MAVGLEDVYAAAERIRRFVLRTPVRESPWLSSVAGAAVHLKLEAIQITSSFKLRGAFNACLRLREEAAVVRPRLVTASAGNHGRALAVAARALDLSATVFISADAPRAKVDAIRGAGAELRECRDYDEAERQAKAHAASGHGLFISPYSHTDVIAGAATIALEILEDVASPSAIIVPIGGGGLISGIGTVVKALSPSTQVIGVEVAASCPFTKSLAAGRLVAIDVQPSLADGLTGNLDPDTITLDIVRRVVDRIVVVDEGVLRRALGGVVSNEHVIVEGAGAAGPAAILAGQIHAQGNVAAVLTGANIDSSTLADILRSA
ncbi:MAG TPA: pyridoxal-phosphate dependent enzyme [Vicinamibacterales bacterium]|nr:pyridoxal-phosphate dependent enzyme [Vicinamibacterales bacterium]